MPRSGILSIAILKTLCTVPVTARKDFPSAEGGPSPKAVLDEVERERHTSFPTPPLKADAQLPSTYVPVFLRIATSEEVTIATEGDDTHDYVVGKKIKGTVINCATEKAQLLS